MIEILKQVFTLNLHMLKPKTKNRKSKFNQSKQTFKIDSNINEKINIPNKKIIIYNDIDNLRDVKLPNNDDVLIVYTNKNTNPSDLLSVYSKDILVFASSINKKAIENINNAKIVVGHHFKKYHYDIYRELNKTSDIKTRLNHAKVLCFREDGNYYCIFGSGNLSDNARHENYRIYNDESVYNYVLNCYEKC